MKKSSPERDQTSEVLQKSDADLESLLKLTEDEQIQQLLGKTPAGENPENIQALRVLWKKEKNRMAAKKSREKKANLMLELEKKEVHLSNEVEALKRLLIEYDTVVDSLLRHVKYMMHPGDWASPENLHNRSRMEDMGEYRREEMYIKLGRCLEYLYHLRNSDGYVVPYGETNIDQDPTNMLIDDILYAIKMMGQGMGGGQ